MGFLLDYVFAQQDGIPDGGIDVVVGDAHRRAAFALVDEKVGAHDIRELHHVQAALDTLLRLLLHDLFAANGVHPFRDGDDLLIRAVQILMDDFQHFLPGQIVPADRITISTLILFLNPLLNVLDFLNMNFLFLNALILLLKY